MADDNKVIFKPELDLTTLDQGADAVYNKLLTLYKQVEALGAAEKKRFTAQLGILEQLELKEARLYELRQKANTTARVEAFNKAIAQTQLEMQKLTNTTGTELKKQEGLFNVFTNKVSGTLKQLGGTILAYFAASEVIGFLKESTAEWLEQEKVLTQLNTTFVTLGKNSTATVKSLTDQAEKFQQQGLVSDEQIENIQLMLSNVGLVPQEIKKAIPVIIDFAAATGKELPEAAQTFIAGLTGMGRELKRYQVFVQEGAGITENFQTEVEGLDKKFHGAADTLRNTTGGELKAANIAWKEFSETLGEKTAPALKNIATFMNDIMQGRFMKAFKGDFSDTITKTTELSQEQIQKKIAQLEQLNQSLRSVFTKDWLANAHIQEKIDANQKLIDGLVDLMDSVVVREPKLVKAATDAKRAIDDIIPLDPEQYEKRIAGLKKFLSDAIKILEGEITEAQLKPKQGSFNPIASMLEFPPTFKEKVQAFVETYHDAFNDIVSAGVQAATDLESVFADNNQRLIDLQSDRVTAALAIADRGNAEYLQREQETLDSLLQKQSDFAKVQQGLNLILGISNSIVAITKAAAQTGVGAPIAIAEVIAALATGIGTAVTFLKSGGFEEGGYTGDGNKKQAAGIVHKKEFVFDAETTERERDIFEQVHKNKINLRSIYMKAQKYDQLNSGLATGRMNEMVVVHNTPVTGIGELNKKVDRLIELEERRELLAVNITREGLAIIATKYMGDLIKEKKLAS